MGDGGVLMCGFVVCMFVCQIKNLLLNVCVKWTGKQRHWMK